MRNYNDVGVYQTEDGCWGYRFKVLVNGKYIEKKRLTDDAGHKFKNKTSAIKARKRAIQMAEESANAVEAPPKPARKTVKDIFEEYCEKGRADRAYNTIKKQDSLWKNYLLEAFGHRYIDEITTAEVVDYLTKLYYEKELAFRYVESFLKMFYLIFGQAYSRGYLDVNAYNRLCVNKDTKIHMPKLKTDDDLDIVAFSREECEVIDNHFRGTNAETAYMLGRFCGLRINECFGLKWQDVDLEKGIIRIRRQMQYQDGLIKLVSLKTRNAKRDIYMNSRVKEYFTALAEKRKEAEQVYALRRTQNQTFILDTDGNHISNLELVNTLPNGHIQTVNSMKYHSRELKKKGINFKYHYLRHTYGTHLAVMNTPTHLLCNQMGHGSIHVTELYYIALSKEGIEVLKNILEQL